MTNLDYDARARENVSLGLIVANIDRMVAKALVVSEVGRIANIEFRMRNLLTRGWRIRSAEASKQASALARKGSSAKEITASVGKTMRRFESDVRRSYAADIESIYRLARKAGARKASGKSKASLQYGQAQFDKLSAKKELVKAKGDSGSVGVDFGLLDEKAVDALQEEQLIWLGEHYEKNVQATLRDEVKATMSAGLGRIDAGKAIEAAVVKSLETFSTPKGYRGNPDSYFAGLAANTSTSARVRGQVRSFDELGVTSFELVNPDDHRTSKICQHLNGKVYLVESAVKQLDALTEAAEPSGVRKAQPWLSFEDIKSLSGRSGHVSAADSATLADAGVALPPFHFHCRTTVDISTI